MMSHAAVRATTIVLLLTVCRVPAAAQQRDPEPLFSTSDAAWAAAFLAGTAALAPLDRYFADRLQDPRSQENRFLRNTASGFRVLGHPGAVVAITGMYAIGRLSENDGLAAVALHAGAALALAEGVTYFGKVVAGRARPRIDPDTPFDFGLFRGLDDDYRSLPSGHASAAFAVAAALTSEAGIRRPSDQWWIGTLLYSSAALVGVSRMYNNEHWASDVVLGAAIGTFSGWKVVRYTDTRPGNDLDGLFLEVVIRPGAGMGVTILPRAWSPLAH
ncbi:MAG: phosphatase PAP2 family protein [Longimicrobiales bacterium]